MSVTAGLPSVKVPVLSKTITFILPINSIASPLLNKIPCSAPRPIPTVKAVGVAKPKAQGQAMIKTVIVATIATNQFPRINQTITVSKAIPRTAGTK